MGRFVILSAVERERSESFVILSERSESKDLRLLGDFQRRGTYLEGAKPQLCPQKKSLPLLKAPQHAKILRLHAFGVPLRMTSGPAPRPPRHPERCGAKRNGVEGSSLVGTLSATEDFSGRGNTVSLPLPERSSVLDGPPTREDPSAPRLRRSAQDDKRPQPKKLRK